MVLKVCCLFTFWKKNWQKKVVLRMLKKLIAVFFEMVAHYFCLPLLTFSHYKINAKKVLTWKETFQSNKEDYFLWKNRNLLKKMKFKSALGINFFRGGDSVYKLLFMIDSAQGMKYGNCFFIFFLKRKKKNSLDLIFDWKAIEFTSICSSFLEKSI